MTPTSKYFSPRELIQPSLFGHLVVSALMRTVGQYNMSCLDILKEDYVGAVKLAGRFNAPKDCWIHINGKYCGSVYKYSGLRSADCTIGAKHSKHKNGNAFDLKCRHMDILLALVLENYKKYAINRIENPDITVPRGWLHCEFESCIIGDLIIFNP